MAQRFETVSQAFLYKQLKHEIVDIIFPFNYSTVAETNIYIARLAF